MSLFDDLAAYDNDRADAHEHGLPALRRLAEVARGGSGQAHIVGRFLLGLYNGADLPFDLNQLRGLDLKLHQDCLAVLRLDYHPAREVHEYLEDGDALLEYLRELVEIERRPVEGCPRIDEQGQLMLIGIFSDLRKIRDGEQDQEAVGGIVERLGKLIERYEP